MKEIQPFQFWNNGIIYSAQYFTLICNSDNLLNQAVFCWQFYDKINNNPGNVINRGLITMTGYDYNGWDNNDYAFNWAAQTLGIVIIGTVSETNFKK